MPGRHAAPTRTPAVLRHALAGLLLATAAASMALLPAEVAGSAPVGTTYYANSAIDTGATDCASATNTDCGIDDAITAFDADTNADHADIIDLSAGVATFTVGMPTAIDNTTGATLHIDGQGQSATSVSGAGTTQVFDIDTGVTVTISDLTVENGQSAQGSAGVDGLSGGDGGNGGGIDNAGALTLTDSTVSHNTTGNGGAGEAGVQAPPNEIGGTGSKGGDGGAGGGIYSTGSLTITNSTVTDNSTGNGANGGNGGTGGSDAPISGDVGDGANGPGGNGGAGGGIYSTGSLTITDGTVSSDTTGAGGNAGSLATTQGTGGDGGDAAGIYSSGSTTITASTVSGNATGTGGSAVGGAGSSGNGGDGGGIDGSFATPSTITNTTISGNTTGAGGAAPFSGPSGNGGSGGNGGGIYNSGNPTITNTAITSNASGLGGSGGGLAGSGGPGGQGGGIYNSGSPTITNTDISGDHTGAGGSGGNGNGISGNGANGGNGGGIYNSGSPTITNTTISNDFTGIGGDSHALTNGHAGNGGDGGGVYNTSGSLTIANTTISVSSTGTGGDSFGSSGGSNGTRGDGGGIYGATGTISGSILSGLAPTGSAKNVPDNCAAGTFTTTAYDIEDANTCGFGANSLVNQSEASIGLSPLATFGGPTETEAMSTSSVGFSLVATGCPSTDQRGILRPATDCAAGAYQPADAPTASIASPGDNGTYTIGQVEQTSFTCQEQAGGPGLTSCDDNNGTDTVSGGSGTLNTFALGPQSYTVTATSGDTQTGDASISYTVNPATPTAFTTTITSPGPTSVGNSWNDAATVTGNTTGGPPTGSVTFTLCSVVSPATTCTGGSAVGTVSTPTTSGDASTFTLPSGDAQTPGSPGSYCYNVAYTATAGLKYVSVGSQSDTECFTVTAATATAFTTAVTSPGSTSVGNAWNDAATVTGNTTGGAPTGSVTFTLCSVVSPATTCTGGSAVGTVSSPTTSGDASTFTLPSGDAQKPNSAGTYCYTHVSYTATVGGSYASVSSQSDTECFSVTAAAVTTFTTAVAAPAATTVGNAWNDAATVTGNTTGGPPTGSVTFTLCSVVSPATTCTGGSPVGTVSSPTTSGDASTFTLPSGDAQKPGSPGSYCYNASYTATVGGSYASMTSQSDTECFTVAPGSATATITAVGGLANKSGTGITTLAVSPQHVGDLMVLAVKVSSPTITASSVTGGGVTSWTRSEDYTGYAGNDLEIWTGRVASTGASTITVTFSASVHLVYTGLAAQEFSSSAGTSTVWGTDGGGISNTSSTTVTYPKLTPIGLGDLYFGYGADANTGSPGTTAGFNYATTSDADVVAYDTNLLGAAEPTAKQSPAGVSGAVAILITATGPAAPPTQPTATAAGGLANKSGTGITTLAVSPQHVGDLMVLAVKASSTTITASSVAGGGVTSWTRAEGPYSGYAGNDLEIWTGRVASTGASTITLTFSASVHLVYTGLAAQEFSASTGASAVWGIDIRAGIANTSSATVTFPKLTPAGTGEIYFGYAAVANTGAAGSTSGFTYALTADDDVAAYDTAVTGAVQPAAKQSPAGISGAVAVLITFH